MEIPSDVWKNKRALITGLYQQMPLGQVVKKICSDNFNPSKVQVRDKLRSWNIKKKSSRIQKSDWENKRALITDLYQKMTVGQMMKKIRSRDFNPSEDALRGQLRSWNIGKLLQKSDWEKNKAHIIHLYQNQKMTAHEIRKEICSEDFNPSVYALRSRLNSWNVRKPPNWDWEKKRALITVLYQKMTVGQMMKEVCSEDFNPSEQAIRNKIYEWGVTKSSNTTITTDIDIAGQEDSPGPEAGFCPHAQSTSEVPEWEAEHGLPSTADLTSWQAGPGLTYSEPAQYLQPTQPTLMDLQHLLALRASYIQSISWGRDEISPPYYDFLSKQPLHAAEGPRSRT